MTSAETNTKVKYQYRNVCGAVVPLAPLWSFIHQTSLPSLAPFDTLWSFIHRRVCHHWQHLAIIGTIVHGALLFMHIKRRGVAVAEANAVPRSQLGKESLVKYK